MTEADRNFLQRKAFTLYQIFGGNASVETFTDDPAVQTQINYLCCLSRKVAFASVIGSHNYQTDIEGSDVDYKVAYYPKFEDFYNGKFSKFSIVTDTFDISINAVHEVHNHMLKANMNAFEPLFSDYCFTDPINMDGAGESYFKRMRYLVNANVRKALLAAYWTAVRNHKDVETGLLYMLPSSHPAFEKEDGDPNCEYRYKKAAMAARMLAYCKNLLLGHTIGESMVVDLRYRDFIKEIKRGEIKYDHYLRWYEHELEEVRHLMFIDGDDQGDLSRRVNEMDETNSGRYEVSLKAANSKLMYLCKENM